MRRHTTTTIALIGSVALLGACGGASVEPADVRATPTHAGSGALEPVMAWSFGDEAITEAGDVDLDFSGAYDFAGNAVTFGGGTFTVDEAGVLHLVEVVDGSPGGCEITVAGELDDGRLVFDVLDLPRCGEDEQIANTSFFDILSYARR
jgi:hypothetical protein